MTTTTTFIDLIGAVALLLWGVGILRKGMEQAFGARMRVFLGAGTSNRMKSFGVGFGTTLVLQSSTATAVMTSSFVEQGLIALPMAVAVMLGADVGTSLVSQFVSLKIQWLSPFFIILGVVCPQIMKGNRGRGLGLAFVGLGLMLLSLKLMGEATVPMRDSEIIRILFSLLGDTPVFAVLASAFLACVAASSLAAILFVLSLYQSGAIDPILCILFVAGANLGGGLPPLFIAGSERAARQVILSDVLIRTIGVVLVVILVLLFKDTLLSYEFGPRLAVDVHVCFNLFLALIFLPFVKTIAKLVRYLVPVPEEVHPDSPKFLDENILNSPITALTAAKREAMRIGDTVERMLQTSLDTLRNDDERLISSLQTMDDKIDRLNEAVKQYLFRLSKMPLDDEQKKLAAEVVSYTVNLEHIGDIIEKSLSKLALKKQNHQISFSSEGFAEIEVMYIRTIENLHLAQTIFMTHDPQLARKLVESKEGIRQIEVQSAENHMKRYQEGRPETIQSSSLHLDIVRDLKRINAHLTPVAYPILTEMGVLRESRLLNDK